MKRLSLVAVCAVLVATQLAACRPTHNDDGQQAKSTPKATHEHQALVTAYIEAFNANDPQRMATLMAEDIEVYYVDAEGKAALGSSGRAALEAELAGYFQQFPSVRSQIDNVTATSGRFTSYAERVTWEQAGEQRTQSSLAVLEWNDDLLQRVWYYPATP